MKEYEIGWCNGLPIPVIGDRLRADKFLMVGDIATTVHEKLNRYWAIYYATTTISNMKQMSTKKDVQLRHNECEMSGKVFNNIKVLLR